MAHPRSARSTPRPTLPEPGGPPTQVFLITGAASGIARHWAETLIAEEVEGRRLALADVNEAGLRAAFEETSHVRLHALDVRSVDGWRAVVDDTVGRFGRVDYLFNIAGGGRPGPLLDVPMELVDTTIDVNLKGQIYGMKVVGPVMAEQGSGHIVNVASLAGIAPTPGNAIYSAAKTGLRAVSIASAIRLRPKGVLVTVVCPDLVDTPTVTRHLQLDPEDVALIYSGPGPLTVRDVERAFRKAMATGRLEIALPTWRGWLVKINNLFPPIMPRLYGPLIRKGLENLERLRADRSGAAAATASGNGTGPTTTVPETTPVEATTDGATAHDAAPHPGVAPSGNPTVRSGTRALRAVIAFLLRRLAKVEVRGSENLPARGPALLVFNQLSLLDTPLMTMLGGGRDVIGLVADDYRKKLHYRLLLEGGGSIWLRRDGAHHTALKAALDALDRGWLVAISPEGRRSPTGALVRGKPGVAFLARRAGVPIVPVAITNTHQVGSSLRRLRRTSVGVRIGRPLRLPPRPPRSSIPEAERGPPAERLREDTTRIMERLAALLPPEYRGVYADAVAGEAAEAASGALDPAGGGASGARDARDPPAATDAPASPDAHPSPEHPEEAIR